MSFFLGKYLGISVDHTAVEGAGLVDGASGVLSHRWKRGEQTFDLDRLGIFASTDLGLPLWVEASNGALLVLIQVLGAVVHALDGAAPLETLLFLLLQELLDDDAEVLAVSLGPLEVLVLISLSKLLEVHGSSVAEFVQVSLKLVLLSWVFSFPNVVLWNAVGLIRALSQSAVVPFWRDSEWVDWLGNSSQAGLECSSVATFVFDEQGVHDFGESSDGWHQDASLVGDELGIGLNDLIHGVSSKLSGGLLEGWVVSQLSLGLLLDSHGSFDDILVDLNLDFFRIDGSEHQSNVSHVLHLSFNFFLKKLYLS